MEKCSHSNACFNNCETSGILNMASRGAVVHDNEVNVVEYTNNIP